jgi:hypothetical protein
MSVDLARTEAPPPALPAEEPAPALSECLPPAIKFVRTRGAQVGNHNVQINRFEISGPAPKLRLDSVLSRPQVQAAQAALMADPADARRRTTFVDSLRSIEGWDAEAKPLVLSATSRPPSFLERVFTVEGLQVGDHSTQRNTFKCCVTDVPEVESLLKKDQALANSLADYLCPRTGDLGNLGTFSANLQRTIRGLPVALTNPCGVGLPMPEPGRIRIVRDIDAVSIGTENDIRTTFDNRVDATKPDVPVRATSPAHLPSPAAGLPTTAQNHPHPGIAGPGSMGGL